MIRVLPRHSPSFITYALSHGSQTVCPPYRYARITTYIRFGNGGGYRDGKFVTTPGLQAKERGLPDMTRIACLQASSIHPEIERPDRRLRPKVAPSLCL